MSPPAARPGAARADPLAPASLGPLRLRNAIVKAATFEGMTPRGVVTDALVQFHRAVAAGGVGMTTVAYCAVTKDGRNAPGQMVAGEEIVPGLRRLTEAVHAEGAALSLQLGHAGAVAGSLGARGISPSPMFSPVAMRRTRTATESDIERVIAGFAAGARAAADAGFDAIELHMGHHYLLSEFHSPRWNRRTDRWGGSLENRARLSREVARAARRAAGRRVAITAKLNMDDGVRGGIRVEEAGAIAGLLESDGNLDALELTGGGSFANPMYLFRGDAPIRELAGAMPPLIGIGLRLAGRRFMPSYPFEEAFFLPTAREIRRTVELPLILLGGITRPDTARAALSEGFGLVAMARALLREPDLVARWRADAAHASPCDHSNRCMATIYRGTHCVLRDPAERPGLAAQASGFS